jgi:murein DD-endopeptidase MepM/ murein hydrolase activator NlpD
MAAGWAELREAAAAAGLMADELAAEAAAKGDAPEPHEQVESFQAPYEPDEQSETPYETWNPTRESTAPPRGRHKVAKPGLFGRRRGTAVFGVAAVAALGVGSGVATAEGHNPLAVSLPDLPDVSSVPGIGALVSADEAPAADPADNLGIDAGEALRTRILDQASAQKYAADNAAAVAEAKSVAAEKVRAQAAAHKAAAAAAKKKAEAARLAVLAKQYVKPVASYTLTAGFGESSSLWSSTHTGQDFAAPTGTPVKAIHGGTITSAGWAGSYGYRIILTLDDGTELWFCHLSSMTVTSGKVSTGDTIGRVGSTGNTTGPHLHLEVRPGGGDPIDPMPWLRSKGLQV